MAQLKSSVTSGDKVFETNRAAGLVVKEFEESVESLEEEQADSEIPEPVKMEEEEDDDLELLEELEDL